MKLLLISLIALVVACACLSERVSFEGYRLLHIFPETDEQVKLILQLEENPDFDIWNNAKGIRKQVDVALSPSAFLTYKEIFEQYNLKYVVVDDNLQNKIDEQELSNQIAKSSKAIVGTFASYADINSFMNQISASNQDKDLTISVSSIGNSYENRAMNAITFKKKTATQNVWIDCGIHARERISVSTCVWIIDYIFKNYASDPKIANLLNSYQLTILPMHNPDGYEYARTVSSMWRKNRRINSGTSCIGVDLNRNYGYKWMTGGSSDNPCSDTYAGPSANSEIETKNVQNWILANNKNNEMAAYLTIHTYGLWWFTPYGFTTTLPADYNEQMKYINIGAAAIKASHSGKGSTFVKGSSAQILYIASGGSEDWTYSIGIKHSTCLELRPGQSGVDSTYGFLLPADRIDAVGEETKNGIVAYLSAILADSK